MAAVALWLVTVSAVAAAQAFPTDAPVLAPHYEQLVCPERSPPRGGEAATLATFAERQRYRDLLPVYLSRLPDTPDEVLLMPVSGVRVAQVADTYAAARDGGRVHEGQDIFAARGTPVVSATSGLIYEMSDRFRGGRSVMVLGPGQRRYFYSHLDAYAEGLREGVWVDAGELLGFVGNDGNAATTPPHLHFGAYAFDEQRCRFFAYDPLPFLVDALP
jgi:peptidoglycan LD-endopeptidase LytH